MARLRRYKSFYHLKLTAKASQSVPPETLKYHNELQTFVGLLRQEHIKHTTTDKPVEDGTVVLRVC